VCAYARIGVHARGQTRGATVDRLQVEGPQGLSRFPMLLARTRVRTSARARALLTGVRFAKNSARNSERRGGRISKIIGQYRGAEPGRLHNGRLFREACNVCKSCASP